MVDAAQLEELVAFLTRSAPPQARGVALDYVVGLTGSAEGLAVLRASPKILFALLDLVQMEKMPSMDLIHQALVNISADGEMKRHFTSQSMEHFLESMLRADNEFADGACMILSNLTREEAGARMLHDVMMKSSEDLLALMVDAFCNLSYNTAQCKLEYMATLLSNVTQVPAARHRLTDRRRCLLQRLLPFTGFEASKVRRGGIAGVIRNCCFDPACHDWLLGEEVSVLSHLLLPLAGPEEFSDEEMDRLPVDLQFLEPTKTREEDPGIRRMLIEAVMQLCATKPGREVIKALGSYYIMRELYNWEKDAESRLACRKLIDVLIADEPDAGMANLRDVDVPEGMREKFEAQEKQDLEDMAQEIEDDATKAGGE